MYIFLFDGHGKVLEKDVGSFANSFAAISKKKICCFLLGSPPRTFGIAGFHSPEFTAATGQNVCNCVPLIRQSVLSVGHSVWSLPPLTNPGSSKSSFPCPLHCPISSEPRRVSYPRTSSQQKKTAIRNNF